MEHIYYGLKQKEFLNKWNFEFHEMKCRVANEFYRDMYEDIIKNEINRLELGATSSYLIRTSIATIDDKVFIDTLEHEHVLEDGDVVELGDFKGKVVKRSYDAVNDVMHYFTDIVALVEINVDLKDEIEKYRTSVLEELKEIQDKYYGGIKKQEEIVENEYDKRNREELLKAENEPKGFWAWLFGGK
jgi:hypothetical protein